LTNKEAILEKLEEKAGPQVRKMFEKFVRDVEKLQAEQEQGPWQTRRGQRRPA
jgi:hypothetical protein